MKIRRLKLKEIKDIYRRHLTYDFPRNERRPLSRIVKYFREHRYEGFGGYDDEGRLISYAFFYTYIYQNDKVCLLDYLAVLPAWRDKGTGSAFLKLLNDCFPHTACMIVEVEDPDYAGTKEERFERERRISFYLRNGFTETGVTVRLFYVDYRLIELPMPENPKWHTHTPDEIRAIIEAVYRSFFPAFFYDRFCQVR